MYYFSLKTLRFYLFVLYFFSLLFPLCCLDNAMYRITAKHLQHLSLNWLITGERWSFRHPFLSFSPSIDPVQVSCGTSTLFRNSYLTASDDIKQNQVRPTQEKRSTEHLQQNSRSRQFLNAECCRGFFAHTLHTLKVRSQMYYRELEYSRACFTLATNLMQLKH